MIDVRLLRQDPDALRGRLAARGKRDETDQAVDTVLARDAERRALIGEGDELKARRNAVSQEVGLRKRRGEPADDLIAETRTVGDRIREIDARLRDLEAEIEHVLLRMPNVTDASVPAGGEESNALVRTWGERREFSFTPRPHWDIGAELGLMDLAGGARVAGSGFPAYRGMGARLQRALINFFLDLHTGTHGYTEVEPPFLVTRDAMQGTGQYPKFVEDGDAYEIEADGLFLVPTSEVPLVNLLREQLLEPGALPVKFTAYSPCFRREAGSAGKDTRGLLRLHQFDKVELVRFEEPQNSPAALEEITAHAEKVLQLLELPYRVLLLAAGDTGFGSTKTYDLEVWAPGVEKWLEVSSASNMGDFQARRAGIRYRPEAGARPEFVHTLNASGVALPRTVIALLENGQQEDGSVLIPQALQPYLGTDRLVRS
ncbi:serine--tRNA ligase [Longimicrobium terrae]|uniref:Serine--tRNA ligase n=1 Tax=Longimicrobium terrae TaxID=1639882 RepID=A0A841GSB1_9BACT|nr:serine--tRNA ligase [Longimicrobium terrae]MBB4635746.1 seryl-tRNA synthetase [Longimicrobium terrae]MBB6070140.1 seryl-tRNA synthetase [Longimicrobium terrae]NNC33041.1 serine--tRNA ligase [Longimicrobium terrae]